MPELVLQVHALVTADTLDRPDAAGRPPSDLGEKLANLATALPAPPAPDPTLPLDLPFRTRHD